MPEHPTDTRGMSTVARWPWGLDSTGPVVLPLAVAAVAWALSADRMAGMGAGPGSELGELGWFTVTWLVMMAAMMLPAATPMVATYARRPSPAGAPTAFAAGYLAAWLAAGLLAYAAMTAASSLDPAFLAWEEAGRYVTAAVIAAAGLYQLTRVKRVVLRRCRARHAFMTERWRPGRIGAALMGIEHGGFCVACCWALMAALIALGWMSLTWMALVAALTAAERLIPASRAARLAVAAALLGLGIAVAVAPEAVPGLTLPGGAMNMR